MMLCNRTAQEAPVAKRSVQPHRRAGRQGLSQSRLNLVLPRNSHAIARKMRSATVVATEAALILKLGMGTCARGLAPMNFVCRCRVSAMSGTMADTPATVDMAMRVAWGPSNMYTAKTPSRSDV